ncbi:hypothetical protein BJV74DRAFT_319327 [Russula compacta]|nr:hypothetical protein BJV74DRAFT_319327 [Russula compacta]
MMITPTPLPPTMSLLFLCFDAPSAHEPSCVTYLVYLATPPCDTPTPHISHVIYCIAAMLCTKRTSSSSRTHISRRQYEVLWLIGYECWCWHHIPGRSKCHPSYIPYVRHTPLLNRAGASWKHEPCVYDTYATKKKLTRARCSVPSDLSGTTRAEYGSGMPRFGCSVSDSNAG